jgi:hypothetical protein
VNLCLNILAGQSYLTPIATITRGRLYLEGRYQYEDIETASVWVGRAFAGGDALTWWIAPLAGGVLGRTGGFAPGLGVELAWGRVSLSSSAEYLFDLEDSDGSYFYSWTEWIYQPWEIFSAGITVERTRPHDTGRDVQTGLTLYSGFRHVTLSFYAFNVWNDEDDYYVCGIGGEF